MHLKRALMVSPVKQAIGDDGLERARVMVTRLKEGGCSVSVIAEGSVFFQASLRDEQEVERVLWDQLRMQGIAFEPVRTLSSTASPFRTKPERIYRDGNWLMHLFHLLTLLPRSIRRGKQERLARRWSEQQQLQWLYFLAGHVLERQSLIFSVEDLQSSWLSIPYQRMYRWSLRLLVGLSSGLLFGPACMLSVSLWGGKAVSPSFGAICGLLFGGLCGLLFFWPGKGLRPEVAIPWRQSLSKGVIVWSLFAGLCLGATVGGITAYTYGGSPLLAWILIPCFTLLVGLLIALFLPCLSQVFSDLPLSSAEYTQSAWHGLLLWLVNVLLLGLYAGVFVGVPLFSLPGQPQTPLGQVLFLALFFALVAMLFPIGLLICLPACLRAGPAWLAQPLLLRLFLRLSGALPWDLHSVLEQAAESGLLHKVDGGYRLSPRLLLSYFDSLDQSLPSHIAELQEPFSVSSFPPVPVRGRLAIITYDGLSLATAQQITMHWGHNDWMFITDTAMRCSRDGIWYATITIPSEATVLDIAFHDQSGTWDNHQHNDYHLPVEERPTLSLPPTGQHISRRLLIGLGALTLVTGAAVSVWRHYLPYPIYTYRGHTRSLNMVAWSPNSQRILSDAIDDTVQIWDATTGRNALIFRDFPHTGAWSPDGTRIVLTSQEIVQVCDATTGRTLLTYRGHSTNVFTVAWSPDGTRIVSGSYGGTVQIWDAVSGHTIFTYQHTGDVWTVAWSPDGSHVASASSDKTVQVWDLTIYRMILTYQGQDVAWSPDGTRIASTPSSNDHTAQIRDLASGRTLVISQHPYELAQIVWSPDGTRIATNSEAVRVWDAVTGRAIVSYRGHTAIVEAVVWSPDGTRIATCSQDETVQVWNAVTGRPLLTYRGHTDHVSAVDWSSDGKHLASGSSDKTVQIWDAPENM